MARSHGRTRAVLRWVLGAGIGLVAGGGAVDVSLHLATDVFGATDAWIFAAQRAGHLVIFAGMAITVAGLVAHATRGSAVQRGLGRGRSAESGTARPPPARTLDAGLRTLDSRLRTTD